MLTYSIYFDESISHFTVYMHREGGLLNWTRSPEDIIEKHVSITEHIQQGEIDSDDAKSAFYVWVCFYDPWAFP